VAVLQLLPDPGIDRYRVRAEFRQDQRVAVPGQKRDSRTAHVGLVLGHARVRAGTDSVVHSLLKVVYNEHDLAPDRVVCLTDLAILEQPLRTSAMHQHRGVSLPLGAGEGEWRLLDVEVTPDEVTVRYGGPSVTCPAVEIRHYLSDRLDAVRREMPQGADVAVPPWGPRLPIGIWVSESWVSVRNVTIEPLP